MRKYQVISADGHVEVPAELWVHRIPSRFQDKIPTLQRHEDGSEWWHLMEFTRENIGNLYSDLQYDQHLPHTTRTYHNPDGSLRPGCGSGVQRLKEQDRDGIDAEVLYPPVYLGAFFRPMIQRDRDAYAAIIQAYNTFLAEDYCSVAPDRLIGNAMVPETGVDAAIAEMERCRKMGLRSISLAMWPNGGAAYKPEDDRFFAAALDLDMKLSPHQGFGSSPLMDPNMGLKRVADLTDDPVPPRAGVGGSLGGQGLASTNIAQLISNRVFEKFPKLKVYFAETQGGWLPHYFSMMDEGYQRNLFESPVKLNKRPSEFVRDHVRFSFISDRMAVKYREDIGTDLLMWGSDFPHSVGTFPHSRDFLSEIFSGVPEEVRRQILVDNVCDFFGLDPNRELTPTPK